VIKHIASCPYCAKGEIAFECDSLELVLNPDAGRQEPCEHLVCIRGFCCRNELLPDGAQRVGFARLDWQCPGLGTVQPDELDRRLRGGETAEAAGKTSPNDISCRVTPMQLEVGRYLSQAETIRWFDQVGWEKAADRETPFGEYQVEGWVGFARHPAELFGAAICG
jgi:hypothetical protein